MCPENFLSQSGNSFFIKKTAAGFSFSSACIVSFSFPPGVVCMFFRLSMSPEEHSEFWRKVQFTVDKDVVRTDRSNHFFRGENNPNVEIMRSDHFTFSPPFFIFFLFTHPTPDLYLSLFCPLLLSPSLNPSLSFPFLGPTHRRTYSFHILNPGGAANEFHALLTLTKPSEHF